MVFAETCSRIPILNTRLELVGIEIPVTSVGDIFSVISLLFIIVIKITEVVCVRVWKADLVFCCDFGAVF